MEKFLKLKLILLGLIFILASCSINEPANEVKTMAGETKGFSKSDYATVLGYSIKFFDANKCGKEVALDNVFSWRSNCHTSDGSDVGLDLTGGYHDAGDHVKFGLPQGYAASVLGWALYEFEDVFSSTGNKNKMLSTLKYFTDYFLRSHPNAQVFYYQVGDGDIDHAYWGPPELQTGARPTLYKADSANAASDVCGQTAAALALMYLNYKSVDLTYANKCLQAAKEIYAIGKNKEGLGKGQSFYQSSSYGDDLAWGAIWLYIATGDITYLTDAEKYITYKNTYGDDSFYNKWTMCWDTIAPAVMFKLYDVTETYIKFCVSL